MFFLEYNNIDALQTSGKVVKKTKDAHTQPHLFVSRSRTLDSMNNRANVSYHWFNWRVLVQFICLNIKVITLYSWIWCYSASVLVFLLRFFFLCCHSFFEWYALRVDFFLSLSLVIVSCLQFRHSIDLLWTCASPCINRVCVCVHMAKNVLLLLLLHCVRAENWIWVLLFFFRVAHGLFLLNARLSPAWREWI